MIMQYDMVPLAASVFCRYFRIICVFIYCQQENFDILPPFVPVRL
ncbi:hypothetical protein MOE33_04085 [Bacillus atrophaeus]|nr:hypothetical protein [Bacillus atrophaeus]MCY8932818.1 hypothetical protein [Bacillus atrophaeus]MCY8942194.1 hypothetical protein [Bacillus atrophaeus]MCY8945120.1 hypothetical protein [Bacillus atrophaeus]